MGPLDRDAYDRHEHTDEHRIDGDPISLTLILHFRALVADVLHLPGRPEIEHTATRESGAELKVRLQETGSRHHRREKYEQPPPRTDPGPYEHSEESESDDECNPTEITATRDFFGPYITNSGDVCLSHTCVNN